MITRRSALVATIGTVLAPAVKPSPAFVKPVAPSFAAGGWVWFAIDTAAGRDITSIGSYDKFAKTWTWVELPPAGAEPSLVA